MTPQTAGSFIRQWQSGRVEVVSLLPVPARSQDCETTEISFLNTPSALLLPNFVLLLLVFILFYSRYSNSREEENDGLVGSSWP
jgi:hypothetical protein